MSVDGMKEVLNIYSNIPDRSPIEDLPMRADRDNDNLDASADFDSSAENGVISDAFSILMSCKRYPFMCSAN